MAKKKHYKTSAYTRSRNNVLRLQRQIQKSGGKISDNRHLFTENEQKLRGLKGKELTKATREMQNLEADLKKQWSKQQKKLTELVDFSDEVTDIYETNRIYEELEEMRPYSEGIANQFSSMYPEGGEVMYDNIAEDVTRITEQSEEDYQSADYTQYYEEFDEKAHEPISQYNQYGRKKREGLYRNQIKAQFTIWRLLMDSVSVDGKSGTGYKIQNSQPNLDENLEVISQYASSSEDISDALAEIEKVLAGRALTLEERADIDEELQFNDVYGEYGLE